MYIFINSLIYVSVLLRPKRGIFSIDEIGFKMLWLELDFRTNSHLLLRQRKRLLFERKKSFFVIKKNLSLLSKWNLIFLGYQKEKSFFVFKKEKSFSSVIKKKKNLSPLLLKRKSGTIIKSWHRICIQNDWRRKWKSIEWL